MIDYQDIVISATLDSVHGDYILTLNKKHFENIPEIKGKALGPKELSGII